MSRLLSFIFVPIFLLAILSQNSIFIECLTQELIANSSDSSCAVINEICSSNKKSLVIGEESSPDWIELYNPNDVAVDLSGYGLSDSKKDLSKFIFPDGTILEPDSYLVVFCDNENSTVGELHAQFKISASGETIRFTDPLGTVIAIIEVPSLDTDTSYGRYPNGTGEFTILSTTPYESNDSASVLADTIAAPQFSVESGFYDEEFYLTITSEDTSILYTIDGSDPTSSDTAILYTDAILVYDKSNDPNVYSAIESICIADYTAPDYLVDKAMVIRATCVNAEGEYSDIVSNTYFVGLTASYYSQIKVVSLVTDPSNLFDDDTGIYVLGTSYTEWTESEDYAALSDSYSTSNITNYNCTGREWEREATVQVFENGELAFCCDVGIRIAGAYSRGRAQKSIRLYARSEYGSSKMKYEWISGLTDYEGNSITSYDKITLRNQGQDTDKGLLRDYINQSLAGDLDIATQGMEFCVLFLDGEFWGMYTITEKYDEEYFATHYGVDEDDITYIKNEEITGDEELAEEYQSFMKWANSADLSLDANYQIVCDTIDIQSLMDYITVETYINNCDWSSSWINNWGVWRSNTIDEENAYADGKWRFLLFDTDASTYYTTSTSCLASANKLTSMNKKSKLYYNFTALFYNLMNNREFRHAFYETYCDIVASNYDVDSVLSLLANTESEAWLSLGYAHFFRWHGYTWKAKGSYCFLNTSLARLESYYTDRPEYALQYLDEFVLSYRDYADVNDDGSITVLDVVALQKYLLGKEDGLPFDMNEDDEVNVYDLVLLRQYLLE